MNKLIFTKKNKFLNRFSKIFPITEAINHLYAQKNGIFILLSHHKAKTWPRKYVSFSKESVQIPLIWALFYANEDLEITMEFSIHPMKCLPRSYNLSNKNSKRFPILAYEFNNKTLSGCGSNVFIDGNRYSSSPVTTQYCSAFGLPDDCYSSEFEKKMVKNLKTHEDLNLWCFEKSDYFIEKIDPYVNMNSMQEEFLPTENYFYVDKSGNFLKGIYKAKTLENLNREIWHITGRELINEMQISNLSSVLYEEDTIFRLKIKILHEFVRQQLLLMNKEKIKSSYTLPVTSRFQTDEKLGIEKKISLITNSIEQEATKYLNSFIQKYKDKIDLTAFNKARFLVMDLEFLRIENPSDKKNSFIRNFPSIMSNIVWHGPRTGFSTHINVFFLPCNICIEKPCMALKKRGIRFDCLHFAKEFISKEKKLIKELLSRYENFKMYSYGQSDICELECAMNFVIDSSDYIRFERKNRVLKKRLIEMHNDVALHETSLKKVENSILKKRFIGWSRKNPQIQKKPTKFMKTHDSKFWKRNYEVVLNACTSDAISCFLYLLCINFGINEN